MGSVVRSVTKTIGKVAASVLGLEPPANPPAVQQVLDSPPAVTPPTPMPTPNDDAVMAAKRKSIADQRQRRGRASTILTAANDTLGG
jgi:hypothetical protein